MEELGVRPSITAVKMVGNVFQELGMQDKYEKLHRKYPPPTWEYRYIKGKRVRIKVNHQGDLNQVDEDMARQEEDEQNANENEDEVPEQTPDAIFEKFEQDSNVIYEEFGQISDDLCENMEPVVGIQRRNDIMSDN